MDQESGNGGRDRPDRQVQRLQADAILLQQSLDQQDRSDGEENILTEEQADIVGRGGPGLHLLAPVIVEISGLRLRRRFGDRRHQRAHGLSVTRDRCEAYRRQPLAQQHIAGEKLPHCRAAHLGDEAARALLQAIGFEQANDRQHDPDDADIARVVERLAEGGEDGEQVKIRR